MTNFFTYFLGFHKKKLATYARNEKQVAAKFVELLVSSNLGLKNLQSKFERTNENDLFSNIKTSLKQGLRADVLDSKSLDLIESCISATLEFLKLKQIPMRVKDEPRTIKSESHSDVSISPEHSSKKRYPSSQHEAQREETRSIRRIKEEYPESRRSSRDDR